MTTQSLDSTTPILSDTGDGKQTEVPQIIGAVTPLGHSAGSEGSGSGTQVACCFASDESCVERARKNREAQCGYDVKTLDQGWSSRYTAVLAMPTNTANERLLRAVAMRDIFAAFVEKASEIAKKLVQEMHLSFNEKTLRPINSGGIAGGEKFVVQGIYFKFARDWMGVYGSDAVAAKAAGHELLSLRSVISLEERRLGTPMMTLLDYGGQRVIAMSLLPITPDTLVYGSADGGRTVVMKDEVMVQIMESCSGKLNLKKHIVGSQGASLCTPGDLEGHKGIDGNYYLVDAARLFPPEAPTKSAIFIPEDDSKPVTDIPVADEVFDNTSRWTRTLERLFGEDDESGNIHHRQTPLGMLWYQESEQKNLRATILVQRLVNGNAVLLRRSQASTLYQLLRPELVGGNPTPLSSDSFTKFSESDPQKDVHNREVSEATARLFHEVIPAFADALNHHVITPVTHTDLSEEMHRHGINLRHLGRLRKLVKLPHLRSFLLTDIVSRVAKDDLRARLRDLNSLPPVTQKRELTNYFNMLLGKSKPASAYWSLNIKARIHFKFIDALTPEEAAPAYDLRNDIIMFTLFQLVCAESGVVFKRGLFRRLFEHPFLFNRSNLLGPSDFDGLQTSTKSSSVIAENLSEMIKQSVAEEEMATQKLVEQIGDEQARLGFRAMKQLKVHRRIETIIGTDSQEAVDSFFKLAERHTASANYELALDAAIRGLSYGEVLFGVFSEAAVDGSMILGQIYEKAGDLLNATHFYRRALTSVQRRHKMHPLVAILSAKIYFSTIALRRDPHSVDPVEVSSVAAEPTPYLRQSFSAFNEIFGSDMAMVMLPLLAFDHGDTAFTEAIAETLQGPDTESSFVRIQNDLWPPRAVRHIEDIIRESRSRCQACYTAPSTSAPSVSAVPMTPAAMGTSYSEPLSPLASLSLVNEETLRQSGVTDPDEIRKAMAAISVVTSIAAKVQQSPQQPSATKAPFSKVPTVAGKQAASPPPDPDGYYTPKCK